MMSVFKMEAGIETSSETSVCSLVYVRMYPMLMLYKLVERESLYTDHLDLINLCSSSHFERHFLLR